MRTFILLPYINKQKKREREKQEDNYKQREELQKSLKVCNQIT